jgi:hypothetical protein
MMRSQGFLYRFLHGFVLLWQKPWAAVLISFLIYSLVAIQHHNWSGTSHYPYFNLLADAFLHGQLNLRLVPVDTHDLVLFQGNYYLYWPPFPAILLLPFIAIWGTSFSDVLFTLVLGSINVGLIAVLVNQAVKHKLLQLRPEQCGLLVLFFAFGTVYFTLVPLANVWFTSQIVSLTCVILAYLSVIALDGWEAFFFSGLGIATAAATRNSLFLVGIWPAYYLLNRYRSNGWRKMVVYALFGTLPLLVVGALLVSYNIARFGSAIEVGITYHQMATVFQIDFTRYGIFSLHYIPQNLFYQWIAYPLPLRADTFMGGSILWLSPVFFGVFWALRKRKQRANVIVLLLTIFLVYIPIVLLMGTGWVQFGPRYTLDFMIPFLLLTGLGIEKWKDRVLGALVYISFIQYLAGTLLLTNIL